jgi:hypothetical protein
VDDETLRIMISTDNHLGYAEKDPVRGTSEDVFRSFLAPSYPSSRSLTRTRSRAHENTSGKTQSRPGLVRGL